ncbi:MAG: DUF4124 domain-containing protein [Desulfuromonas sp.]|nr:DUF4124 domain-containing protein [Desulfuromonas sp.]
MRVIVIVVTVICLLPVSCLAGQLYKWIDEKGGLHYSDRHPGSLENLRDFENLSYPDSKPRKAAPLMEHRLDPPVAEVVIDAPQGEQGDTQDGNHGNGNRDDIAEEERQDDKNDDESIGEDR